uniref:Uncharacterized protein n=1 Tax=Anguilla anguilla TaxID=7936 RepID=A0A0E9PBE2_ANGAN
MVHTEFTPLCTKNRCCYPLFYVLFFAEVFREKTVINYLQNLMECFLHSGELTRYSAEYEHEYVWGGSGTLR